MCPARERSLLVTLAFPALATVAAVAVAAFGRPDHALAANGGRLPDGIAPTRYRLELEVDPARAGYRGRIEIEIALGESTSEIRLHARALSIDRALFSQGGRSAQALASHEKTPGAHEPDLLVIALARPAEAGKAMLELDFHADFETRLNGLYRVHDGGAWYAFTQMEPTDARRAFPCFDEPRFKVPWEVAVRVPSGQLAFANTPESERRDHADGTTTFRFTPTPPLPSYLVAIAAGPLEVLEGARTPVPFRLITTRGKSESGRTALALAPRLLALLTDYLGEPYPFAKLDLAALPEFVAGAMENPGLITFREEFLLVAPGTASTDSRRFMTIALAHELAHQWFGNLVTPSWWDEIWLNEGFATWMEAKLVDRLEPGFKRPLEQAGDSRRAMALDALGRSGSVRRPVTGSGDAQTMFDSIRFAKGAAILTMIESWLGEDRFRDAIRSYLAASRWANVRSEDFVAALAHEAGPELAAVAPSFVDLPGVPLVTAALECRAGLAARVTLTQRRFGASVSAGGDEQPWTIPVRLGWSLDGRRHETRVLLTRHEQSFDLESAGCPDWIHPSAGETGYYRWTFSDPRDWSLARRLEPIERSALLEHALALVEHGGPGELEASTLLELAASVAGDGDRSTTESLTRVLDRGGELMVAEPARRAYAAFVSDLLLPGALALGFRQGRGGDDEQLLRRQALLDGLALDSDEGWVQFEAEALASVVLSDFRALDPDAAARALRVGSRHADGSRSEALRQLLAAARTPSERLAALAALGHVCDAGILRRNLDLTIGSEVRAQDVGTLLHEALGDRDNREVARSWLIDNWPALSAKLHVWSLQSTLERAVRSACSGPEIESVERRFVPLAAKLEGGERSLRSGLEEARSCAAIRSRTEAQVRAWLRNRVNPAAAATLAE